MKDVPPPLTGSSPSRTERQTEAQGSGRSGASRISEIPDLEGLGYLLWKRLIPFLWTFLEGFLLF